MSTAPTPAATLRPDPERRIWLLNAAAASGVAAVGIAVPLTSSLAPSERAKVTGAPVEIELSDIRPGTLKTAEWRGKPVWVLRRTPQMLQRLGDHDAQLADPSSAKDTLPQALHTPARALQPEFLVVIGVCTHLGCSPSLIEAGSANPSVGADWPGGFFCPCHGSTFDLAGRVFRNKPAPTNLEIPPHRYLSPTRLLVGET